MGCAAGPRRGPFALLDPQSSADCSAGMSSNRGRRQVCAQTRVGCLDKFVDPFGVRSIQPKDAGGIALGILDPGLTREQHRAPVSRVVARRPLERDEAVAHLVASHPRPQAQFVVEADPGSPTFENEWSQPPSCS
jgi:hypothetical protein